MMITDEMKAKYRELKAKADALYAAAEPQRAALASALEPYHDLVDQIEELVDGEYVHQCEGCSGYIFEGDKKHSNSDGDYLCESCSPTYASMLSHPENFTDDDEEDGYMKPETAKRICDAHVAAGGQLSDTMAT